MSLGLGLNKHSKRTFDILKAKEILALEGAKASISNSDERYLVIEIDCPNPKAKGIYFDTADENFTLGFDAYHCHFFVFAELVFEEELNKAIETLRRIMQDDLVVVKCMNGGKEGVSVLIEAERLDSIFDFKKVFTEYDCEGVSITSWTGNMDRKILVR